jgi:chromosome partitioning protein
MGSIIAIMNAKGGVGKSTTTMMLAESLCSQHRKRILIVDTDPQANASLMLLGPDKLEHSLYEKRTFPQFIRKKLISGDAPGIEEYIIHGASDINNINKLDVIPGSVELAWVERDSSENSEYTALVEVAAEIRELSKSYDFVLIDCPPSMSYFTECWMTYSDFHLAPAKPDLLSFQGLGLIRQLRTRAAREDRKLAREIGVVFTIVRTLPDDERWMKQLREGSHFWIFPTIIKQMSVIQRAADFQTEGRVFSEKYSGGASSLINQFTNEFVERLKEIS